MERIDFYLEEGEIHKERILKAIKKLPKIDGNILNNDEYLAILDSLAFRFSRLQVLLGEKIFKEYLIFTLKDVEGKSFIEILRMLEKEGLINIEEWKKFREVRNFIFHDYPLEIGEKIEAINFLLDNAYKLISIFDRIKAKIETIRTSN